MSNKNFQLKWTIPDFLWNRLQITSSNITLKSSCFEQDEKGLMIKRVYNVDISKDNPFYIKPFVSFRNFDTCENTYISKDCQSLRCISNIVIGENIVIEEMTINGKQGLMNAAVRTNLHKKVTDFAKSKVLEKRMKSVQISIESEEKSTYESLVNHLGENSTKMSKEELKEFEDTMANGIKISSAESTQIAIASMVSTSLSVESPTHLGSSSDVPDFSNISVVPKGDSISHSTDRSAAHSEREFEEIILSYPFQEFLESQKLLPIVEEEGEGEGEEGDPKKEELPEPKE